MGKEKGSDFCWKCGSFCVFLNMMVDKAQMNNPSELSTIKSLCEKSRPNLLSRERRGSGTAHTCESPSILTRVTLSLSFSLLQLTLQLSLCLAQSFGFSFSPSLTAHSVTPKLSDECSHYKFRGNLSYTFQGSH